MPTNQQAFENAKQKIEQARRDGATELRLSDLGKLDAEQIDLVVKSVGQLTQLHTLNLAKNQLTALPESLGQLTQLQKLNLAYNQLTALPESLGQLTQLQKLQVYWNQLTALPAAISGLKSLQKLDVSGNQLQDVPNGLAHLTRLESLHLDESIDGVDYRNPLNPELAAANEQGLGAVKDYLRAKAEDQIVLNEAKLILIGEGEVGKTSLLGALRGDEWVENRQTNHVQRVGLWRAEHLPAYASDVLYGSGCVPRRVESAAGAGAVLCG